MPYVARERVRAAAWGLLFTGVLAILIVVGSRNLEHFDAALVGYTFATLFAAFGITYRYAMWLQRPPTRMYWRRGWKCSRHRGSSAGMSLNSCAASSSSSPSTGSSSAVAGHWDIDSVFTVPSR